MKKNNPARSLALVTLTITATLQAAPVIYEPFNYPAAPLNGATGSSELGFNGAWSANSTSNVVENDLAYGSLATTGGSIGNLSANFNRFGGARTVDAAALAGNGLLDDGATLWFSIVGGLESGNLLNSRLGFALANSSFSTGNYDYWIADEGSQLGSGLGLTVGRRNGTVASVSGSVYATQFQDFSAGDAVAGNVLGTFTGTSYNTAGDYGLIVGKIEWGATSDTIELYQPDAALNLGPVISTLTVDVDQSTYDTITWARGNPVMLDEIRFGASLADVTPAAVTAPLAIRSFTSVGGGVWELMLEGEPSTAYEFRSSTTLDFTPGTLVENLSQADPGDPGAILGPDDSILVTDGSGQGTLRMTLFGNPADFVRAQQIDLPPLLDENFDLAAAMPTGWSSNGPGNGTNWEVGTPSGVASGPAAASSPPNCAGTNISGYYTENADVSLSSPSISIPAGNGATLTFQQFIDTDLQNAVDDDAGSVRILDADNADSPIAGLEITNIEGQGATDGWSTQTLALPVADVAGKNIKIEFRFKSNAGTATNSAVWSGFYVDDVKVVVGAP